MLGREEPKPLGEMTQGNELLLRAVIDVAIRVMELNGVSKEELARALQETTTFDELLLQFECYNQQQSRFFLNSEKDNRRNIVFEDFAPNL
jgi:hypothetical protein